MREAKSPVRERRPREESIATLLQLEGENPDITTAKLAEKLGVSIKSIRNHRSEQMYLDMNSAGGG